MLSILSSFIGANQATKLAHQLILLTNAFLDLVVKKVYIYTITQKAASETVRE